MKAAALAIGFVLVGASDWELRVDTLPDPICAKSEVVCEAARRAIAAGWWRIDELPPTVATSCAPAPGCFDPASDFIAGFNMPENLRR